MVVQAYAPLASPGWQLRPGDIKDLNLFKEPAVVTAAEKHGKTVGQIIIAWHLAKGHTLIPKSTNLDRLKENFESIYVKLDEEDIAALDKLDIGRRFFQPSDEGLKNYGWN